MSKTTSSVGLNLIKGFEGKRTVSYDDGVGVWTIGYGTIKYPNGVRVKKGDTCTEQQAEDYLRNDLAKFETAINKLVKVPLTQNQFDALASFTYNLGETNLANSTLLKKLNKRDYQGAADQFLVWNRAGGKVMKGLVRRREAERALFLKK
ncbi:lysozyme [Acinetobacter sp. IRS14]|uniref:lysozyme n=1 Tax=Acinetobacter sp. IRS14 TaxID=2983398 RepID=UPI002B001397|nr:lysozyme [Acinetobacter sp. IRS14]MEA1231111.1 lysozyme [Acinetobacter sp. IRS14]